MCTAITFQSMQKENFFGRTMDFSHPIEPGVFVIPKDYEWYSLASCSCVADLKSLLKNVTIVGIVIQLQKQLPLLDCH